MIVILHLGAQVQWRNLTLYVLLYKPVVASVPPVVVSLLKLEDQSLHPHLETEECEPDIDSCYSLRPTAATRTCDVKKPLSFPRA